MNWRAILLLIITCSVATIVCVPGYQNTATNCTDESLIVPIAGGAAGGGGLLIMIIGIVVLVCVCKCKNRHPNARDATTVIVASRSEEKVSMNDDSLLYSAANKTNGAARPTMYSPTHTDTEACKEAVTITLNQEEGIYSETLKISKQEQFTIDIEPQYSTPSNVTTPQYNIPTTSHYDVPTSPSITHYSTPTTLKTLKEPQYSTPGSRENTLPRTTPQYSAPTNTLPRRQPEQESHYNTPAPTTSAKDTTLSAKKPKIVYADLKVSTLPRAGAEHTQTTKVDKKEAVQYSEIKL